MTEHAPPETRPSNGPLLPCLLRAHSRACSRASGQRPAADEADVIVVGAGPAGATTAFYLAQSGLDVLLLRSPGSPGRRSAATA